jgi:glycosyltransferase involved in cell wall biosynthesis
MSATRLHWICWQPTPYNNYLFRSVAADPEIDLTVHFMESAVPSHPWKSQLACGFKSRTYKRLLGLDWHLLRLAVLDEKSFFIIGSWHELTVILLINLLILYRRPFAVWTDTPNLDQKRNPIKGILRKIWLQQIFTHACYLMGTGIPAISALEKMNCHRYKLVNFPYFIDLDFFTPISKPREKKVNDQIVFLSSGQLVNSHKGYDLALRALAITKEKIVNHRFLYRIAGIGPDKETLESIAKEVGLFEELEFVGWLEPGELLNFYRSGDVFLHPSPFDPYGNSVLEAMASGLPVIGSDKAGSVLDRIKHMENGLVHRANDIDDLADKIIYTLSHPETLCAMGAAARRTAEEWPISRAVQIIKSSLRETS